MIALAGAQKAAEAGDLQYLQSKAHMLERPLLEQISLYAARGGQLEVLQWLSLQGAALSPHMCTWAAEGGHLAVLQYAHQNGCAWDSSTCEAAAGGGHLAVLQYAHQNSCTWGPAVCSAAAELGNLSILRWLRQHGCPWDWRTTSAAAVGDHLEVLRWARLQQPPCPLWPRQEQLRLIIRNLSPCMLVYLLQQQAPMSARHLAQARAAATKMTYAVLSLRAALPDRTPHEAVLKIASLALMQAWQ